MVEATPPTPPPQNEQRVRIIISKVLITQIRRSGYEPQEALAYFAQLLKDIQKLENENNTKNEEIRQTMKEITKISAAYHLEAIKSERLRQAIVHHHPNEYWEIIKKAEKGYYRGNNE